MDDEFLKAFNENRRLRLERDRSFEIGGLTLTHRAAVAPEVPMRFQDATDQLAQWANDVNGLLAKANGTVPDLPPQPITEADLLHVYDDTILACLEPSAHENWARLRNPDAELPLLGEEVYRLAVYLIGKTTSLPTDGLLGSSSTQPETEPTSKENSPSPAPARKTSARSSPQPTSSS